ncbi:hypothetical protein SK128_002228, partial [Halocaridina rubra]
DHVSVGRAIAVKMVKAAAMKASATVINPLIHRRHAATTANVRMLTGNASAAKNVYADLLLPSQQDLVSQLDICKNCTIRILYLKKLKTVHLSRL